MAGSEFAKKVRPNKGGETDERRLVEAAQREPARFADLYENYFELVYAYVARRVQTRDAAEDLTSEVFRKALHKFVAIQMDRRAFRRVAFPDSVESNCGSSEARG